LQNLTSDTPKQSEAFFAHIGHYPTRLISDFDMKLIGLRPAHRQDKNGLQNATGKPWLLWQETG
jgi:hypothetical protein